MAASISWSVQSGTRPMVSPVAGLVTMKSGRSLIQLPLMYMSGSSREFCLRQCPIQLINHHIHRRSKIQRLHRSRAGDGETAGAQVGQSLFRYAPGFVAKKIAVVAQEAWAGDWLSANVQAGNAGITARSEEHTSELQSRPHLVCRLLL